MTKNVEFIWWSSRKIWKVWGKDLDEIVKKCDALLYKYHAQHYQILD
jgi:hypothetical protein